MNIQTEVASKGKELYVYFPMNHIVVVHMHESATNQFTLEVYVEGSDEPKRIVLNCRSSTKSKS